MIPVASDVHEGRCWFGMLPPGEELKMLEPIECTREAWRKRLGELPPEAEIALEVSTRGYFVMTVLEEAGWRERAHWVHTAGIDSLRKQKSDRLDTRRLVKKLAVHAVEPLPEAWFPPAPIRALRPQPRDPHKTDKPFPLERGRPIRAVAPNSRFPRGRPERSEYSPNLTPPASGRLGPWTLRAHRLR